SATAATSFIAGSIAISAASASLTLTSSSAIRTLMRFLRGIARRLRGGLRTRGNPELHGRAGLGSAVHAQPPADQLGPLSHRGEPEVPWSRSDPPGLEADAVVGDADAVATVLLEHGDLCGRGPGVFADVRERLLRDSVEDHTRLLVRLRREPVVEPELGRALFAGLLEVHPQRLAQPLAVEGGRAQLEQQVPQARDRELDRVLEVAE